MLHYLEGIDYLFTQEKKTHTSYPQSSGKCQHSIRRTKQNIFFWHIYLNKSMKQKLRTNQWSQDKKDKFQTSNETLKCLSQVGKWQKWHHLLCSLEPYTKRRIKYSLVVSWSFTCIEELDNNSEFCLKERHQGSSLGGTSKKQKKKTQ